MRRREFIALLGGAAPWPLVARAQAVPVIGVLRINPRESEIFAEPFRHYMNELGWEEGPNIRFEFVWADGRYEDLPALARDLVARGVDVIVTFGNPGISAIQRATTTIPIVGMSDDMVREGLAASMPPGHCCRVPLGGANCPWRQLTPTGHCRPKFAVMHNTVPMNGVVECDPQSEGAHATTRVHHAARRRRGRMALRCGGAGAGSRLDFFSHELGQACRDYQRIFQVWTCAMQQSNPAQLALFQVVI
jgi:hypothetical protein